VLVKKHGVGTFVSEPPPVLECVLHENLGVTEMITRSGLTPGTPQRSVIDPYRDADVAALLGQPKHLIALERLRTADERPIAVTTDVFSREIVESVDELGLDDISIYELLERHGVQIVHGTATLVPTQASADVAAALSVPTGSVLLMLEQVDCDQHGAPVVFSRELWVRRAIRFVVDRRREARPSQARRRKT
jgi:GntR family transcriptional regulator